MTEGWAGEFAILSDAPEVTERLGSWLGDRLGPGCVVDLRGPLGAGKTQFVRGVARALGVTGTIRSPTFTICHVHEGPVPLVHIDAYRVEEPTELLLQGWDELRVRAVMVVEWGERVAELLGPDRTQVTIEHLAPGERRLLVSVGDVQLWRSLDEPPAERE